MSGRYRTIVADPPWKVNAPNGWGNEALEHVSIPAVAALPGAAE